jgi:hypothetical protein
MTGLGSKFPGRTKAIILGKVRRTGPWSLSVELAGINAFSLHIFYVLTHTFGALTARKEHHGVTLWRLFGQIFYNREKKFQTLHTIISIAL